MDHHCHPLLKSGAPRTGSDLRRAFTEAFDAAVIETHTQHLIAYRYALHRIAEVLGCDATEQSVLEARRHVSAAQLMERTRTGMLILDHGYAGGDAMTPSEHAKAIPIAQREVVRLETIAEEKLRSNHDLASWVGATAGEVRARVGAGAVGVKTIAAYRAGLRLEEPDPGAVAEAFVAVHARAEAGLPVRIEGALLCHTLVFAAAAACAELRVPLQVHCGFGDPDEDMSLASPLGLRPLLVDERFAGLELALLHCYPYHREAAYLASVFPGVYMDLSLAIPMAAHDGASALKEALGLCPLSKLLYATDATRYAEVYVVAAELHRRALAEALGQLAEGSWLTRDEAVEAGRAVLAGNARRLYRLD